jgi:hypothetical protein
MNIGDFKAVMNKYGGVARPNTFMVDITATGSEHVEDSDLRFFCKTAAVPGFNFSTSNYRPYSIGPDYSIASGLQHEPLSCVFILDSNHAILSFFHTWAQKIVNYNTSNGMLSSVDNMYPYELGYKENYTVSMRIRFFNAHDPQSYYEVELDGVWPTSIGQVSLNWEENDSYATIPITFSYDGIKFSSTLRGSPTERYSRSNGVIGRIAELASAQSIRQSSLPRSIQNAIDKYSRLKNTFNEFKHLMK